MNKDFGKIYPQFLLNAHLTPVDPTSYMHPRLWLHMPAHIHDDVKYVVCIPEKNSLSGPPQSTDGSPRNRMVKPPDGSNPFRCLTDT